MKLYGAIDLHSTNNVTVVIDEQDRVVYQKRLPNDLALILKELSVYQAELQGSVVESTYNSQSTCLRDRQPPLNDDKILFGLTLWGRKNIKSFPRS